MRAIRLEDLHVVLAEPEGPGALRLEPLAERHLPGLAACMTEDDPVWEIYPADWRGGKFAGEAGALLANAERLSFAVVVDGAVAGMTAYLGLALGRQTLEIGGTFMAPWARGTGLNARAKALVIGHAFACGVRRIEFRIDVRNARSGAAVAKLGAVREGVLRAERVTWTGHLRDTGLWSLLASDWRAPTSPAR